MQGNQNQIDINYVMKEYQEMVADLTNENVFLKAYIKQLEDKLGQLEEPTSQETEDTKQ